MGLNFVADCTPLPDIRPITLHPNPRTTASLSDPCDRAEVGDFGMAIDRYQNNALLNVSNLYPEVDFSVKIDMLESPMLA